MVNYCLTFYCYQGAKIKVDSEKIKKYGLGHVVVNNLLNAGNYFMKGCHVVVDNFLPV